MSGHAEGRWTARLVNVWGHYAPEMLCVAIVIAIISGVRPPSGVFAATLPLSLVSLVLVSWLLMRRHDRALCEQCVASMPLNAAERAVHFQRRFWMAHTGSERRFLLPYLAVLIGSNFFPGTWGRIVWALIQCSMIYLIMSHVTHRRFQPWCPWCNGNGGGRGFDVDSTPPPLPTNDRQLV